MLSIMLNITRPFLPPNTFSDLRGRMGTNHKLVNVNL